MDDRRVNSDSPSPPDRPNVETPRLWRFAPDAWRASKRLNERRIDLYLRLRGGKPYETAYTRASKVVEEAGWAGLERKGEC